MASKRIPRRAFLRMFAGAVAASFSGYGFGAIPNLRLQHPSSGMNLKGPLSYEVFAALQGDTFILSKLNRKERKYRVHLRLLEVVQTFPTPEYDQFSLIFQVDDSADELSGTFRVRHKTAGQTLVFLQPMGVEMPGNYLRADFNLLR